MQDVLLELLAQLPGWVLPLMVLAVMLWLHQRASLPRAFAAFKKVASRTEGLEAPFDSLQGTVQGVEVRVTVEEMQVGKDGRDRRLTCFELVDPEAALIGLRPLDDVHLPVRTGDPVFDRFVGATGAPAEVLASLDDDARQLVRPAVLTGWTCNQGVWRMELRRRLVDPDELETLLLRGVAACRATRRPDSLERGLLDVVTGPELPAVRQEALAALLTLGELSAEAEAVLLDGPGTVAVPIAERLPSPRDVESLSGFVDDEDGEVSFLATAALVRKEADPELCRRGLVRALFHPKHHLDAVDLLGQVGTVDDVMTLRSLVERAPHAADGVEAAVQAIQSRARGAGAGQLSVADQVGGELSLAQQAARRRQRE